MPQWTRRDILKASAWALAAAPLAGCMKELAGAGPAAANNSTLTPGTASAASSSTPPDPAKKKRLLFFTKSQTFPHDGVTRKVGPDGKPGPVLAWGEQLLKDWTEKAGYDIVISKEGSIFTPENIASFDAFIFYTTGILTDPAVTPAGTTWKPDQTSPMSKEGKAAFLKAIEDGKGFLGLHCATDTFHPDRKGQPNVLAPIDTAAAKIDPYNLMIGAEFTSHGSQQMATLRVGSKTFPGLQDLKEFSATEEWYAFTNMSPDLHVIFAQDTSTMKVNGRTEAQYSGPMYPETWARMHGKGRVFYSSMGHRQDVWQAPVFSKILLAGLAWTTRQIDGDIPPNIHEVCPGIIRKA